jgi:hypothetical protein
LQEHAFRAILVRAKNYAKAHTAFMSLTQLKDEAARLPSKEQRELIAFLVSLQTAKDEEFRRTLAARIDDRDPGHWVELDELQKRYAE